MTEEIKEAKSLRWLANQFPLVEHPQDDADRMANCIHLYCTAAAEKIEQQNNVNALQKEIESVKAERDEALKFIRNYCGCGECLFEHTEVENPPCDECMANKKTHGSFSEWKWRGNTL